LAAHNLAHALPRWPAAWHAATRPSLAATAATWRPWWQPAWTPTLTGGPAWIWSWTALPCRAACTCCPRKAQWVALAACTSCLYVNFLP